MEPLINFTEPFTVVVTLVLFILFLWLGKETKKSIIPAIFLGIFLFVIVGHSIEFSLVKESLIQLQNTIAKCITVDFMFVLISFLSYLWIDEIEAKTNKKKSIDNSLNWFWSKV